MKLKNRTLLMLLMIAFGIFKMPAENVDRVLWGIKATVDAELPGKWHGDHASFTMYRPGVGFSIGGVSNIWLGKYFYFEPGVSLYYSQYRFIDLIIEEYMKGHESDPKLYKWGVEVPLTIGYEIGISKKFSMTVFTGPVLRYAFKGDIVIKNKDLIKDFEHEFTPWDFAGQRRFDCEWKVGIGFPVHDFTLSLEADLGITDLQKNDVSFRENRLGLGLTYYF